MAAKSSPIGIFAQSANPGVYSILANSGSEKCQKNLTDFSCVSLSSVLMIINQHIVKTAVTTL